MTFSIICEHGEFTAPDRCSICQKQEGAMDESTLSAEQIAWWKDGLQDAFSKHGEKVLSGANKLCDQALSAISLRERLADAEQYREKYLQLSVQHVREVEAGERALADAQAQVRERDERIAGLEALTDERNTISDMIMDEEPGALLDAMMSCHDAHSFWHAVNEWRKEHPIDAALTQPTRGEG